MKTLAVVSIAWVLADGAFALAQGTADIAPSGTLHACVRMPGISGLELQQKLKSLGSTTDTSLDYGHLL
jgi:FixJ family two-component response regulator